MNVCHKCTTETRRSATCHVTCDRYIKEKAEYESQREKVRKNRLANIQYNQYKFDVVHNMRKWRNTK